MVLRCACASVDAHLCVPGQRAGTSRVDVWFDKSCRGQRDCESGHHLRTGGGHGQPAVPAPGTHDQSATSGGHHPSQRSHHDSDGDKHCSLHHRGECAAVLDPPHGSLGCGYHEQSLLARRDAVREQCAVVHRNACTRTDGNSHCACDPERFSSAGSRYSAHSQRV